MYVLKSFLQHYLLLGKYFQISFVFGFYLADQIWGPVNNLTENYSTVTLSRSLWTQYVTYTISLQSIKTNLKNTCEKTESFNVLNIFNIFENNNSKSNQNLVFDLKSYPDPPSCLTLSRDCKTVFYGLQFIKDCDKRGDLPIIAS